MRTNTKALIVSLLVLIAIIFFAACAVTVPKDEFEEETGPTPPGQSGVVNVAECLHISKCHSGWSDSWKAWIAVRHDNYFIVCETRFNSRKIAEELCKSLR